MSSALLKRKLDSSFRRLDADRNGYAERADFQDVGARLIHGFGQSPTSPKGKVLAARLDAVWAELAAYADADRDGRITSAEYHAGMTAAFIEGPGFTPVFHPAAEAVAALCDSDDDGRLRREEFVVLHHAFNTPAGEEATSFNRIDTDGDGHLAVGELVAAIRQYYIGTDPKAPGNWLFGPL
jgi:Ca2+-binding EF-hand superfamily protein